MFIISNSIIIQNHGKLQINVWSKSKRVLRTQWTNHIVLRTEQSHYQWSLVRDKGIKKEKLKFI